ncbi:ATPase involved in DNA repair [Collimonas arenae]|uniref:ATPase involved in DNA repair n=1 Tax=Collimonas arenae TaxID=279058 RepID=A0A0A1FB54_9BURK|nr:toll/interleukin-1 receptor domain-containing protein [Collimonas arenae]AIY41983.1 ATPase involved in DNA repair [Collimonas arenae]
MKSNNHFLLFMNHWNRIRSAVRGAQAAIASEPKQLASIAPLIEDALIILAKRPSKEAIGEVEYLLKRAQEFVVSWRPSPRPSPGVFYVQPGWAKSTDDQTSEALSLLQEFRQSDLIESTATEVPTTMKIFISHSNADATIAEALVELIRASLNLSSKDIRCTSVDGYKLPAGADSDQQLRSEVFESQAFIALLSPVSLGSIYVMFELGARWGAGRYLAPIMIGGTKGSDLKAPLSAIHAISGTSEADIHQLVEKLAEKMDITPEKPSGYSKALRLFTKAAAAK